MKFFGNGIVWDGQQDRALCEFVDGEFETADPRMIIKLRNLGYEFEAGADPKPELDNVEPETLEIPVVDDESKKPKGKDDKK